MNIGAGRVHVDLGEIEGFAGGVQRQVCDRIGEGGDPDGAIAALIERPTGLYPAWFYCALETAMATTLWPTWRLEEWPMVAGVRPETPWA